MSAFMQEQEVEDFAVWILINIYFFHVVLMKLNYNYEVWLKKSVASWLEVRELKKLATEDITHFHYNLDTRCPSIEILNRIEYRQEGDILIFENSSNAKNGANHGGQFMARQNQQIRYRMRPIQKIKIREERFATPDNKSLMAKARMKQAVIKILIKLQAFHIYEKIKRNKHCVIPVTKFVKDYHPYHAGCTKPEDLSANKQLDPPPFYHKQMNNSRSESEEEEIFDDEEISDSNSAMSIKDDEMGSEFNDQSG
jgi:hypothetical protein